MFAELAYKDIALTEITIKEAEDLLNNVASKPVLQRPKDVRTKHVKYIPIYPYFYGWSSSCIDWFLRAVLHIMVLGYVVSDIL